MKNLLLLLILSGAFLFALSLMKNSRILKGEWYGQDIDQYYDYSNSLLHGHGFSAQAVSNMYFIHPEKNVYVSEILRLPAYSVLIALGRLLYDDSRLLLFYNFFFFIGILFYSFKVMKMFLSPWFTVLGMTYIAWDATQLFYTGFMATIATFMEFVLIGFTYHMLQLLKVSHRRWLHAILASLFGAVAVLGRPDTFTYIFALVLLISLYSLRKIRLNNSSPIRYIVVIFLVVSFAQIGWILRNHMVTGKFIFSAGSGTYLAGEYTYFTRSQDADSKKIHDMVYVSHFPEQFIQQQRDAGKSVATAYAEYNSIIKGIMQHYLVTHPIPVFFHFFVAARSFYTDLTFNWDAKDMFSWLIVVEHYGDWLLFIFSFAFPLIYLLVKKDDRFVLVSLLWCACFAFTSSAIFFHGTSIGNRGFLPVLPIITIAFIASVQGFLFRFLSKKFFDRAND